MLYLYHLTVKFNDNGYVWTGDVEASNPATAACRGIKDAKKAFPKQKWHVLLLEIEKEVKP